jgi:hypothetical protein
MRAGRNDPCPCGSGKKYKKCCWEKDRDEESKKPLVPTPPAQPRAPLPPPVPAWVRHEADEDLEDEWEDEDLEDEWEDEDLEDEGDEAEEVEEPVNPAAVARWEEFEAADFPQRLELFDRTLDEGLMDHENAFAMLTALHEGLIQRGERERFDELVEAMQKKAPASYASNAVCFLVDQISDALALNRLDRLPELAVRLGEQGEEMSEIGNMALLQLMYRGQQDVALAMLRTSWPKVHESTELLPWAVEQDRSQGANLEVCTFLESNPQAEGNEPVLRERVRFFVEDLDEERLAEVVALLSGRKAVSGSLADYQGLKGGKKGRQRREIPQALHRRLTDLGFAFVGYLRRELGVPYSKGDLARQGIIEYLIERATGRLERRGGGIDHPLAPEYANLDEYLSRYFSLLDGRTHQGFAIFELIPAWLRFLVSLGLLTVEQSRKVFAILGKLREPFETLRGNVKDDPRLGEGLSAWDSAP